MTTDDKKKITDYFRSNIFEAWTYYNAWKMLSYSKSKDVVSEHLANRYMEIQKYHPSFFGAAERSFLVSFIILVLHPFDRRDDSYSLYKVDKEATEAFVQSNESILDALKTLRNKLFAHRDANLTDTTNLIIPSAENMDTFFKHLAELYNKFTAVIDDSTTLFENTENVKDDIERLFMNLYRGEATRLKEINIEWDWQQNPKKASDLL